MVDASLDLNELFLEFLATSTYYVSLVIADIEQRSYASESVYGIYKVLTKCQLSFMYLIKIGVWSRTHRLDHLTDDVT